MQNLSYSRVWQIAWPIILSNITIPLVGAVDTAVIGQLPGAIYIAAVALGAIIFDFLFWGFNFLKIGTSGLTAQAIGSDSFTKAGEHISRAIVIALVAACLLLVIHQPIINFALNIYETEAAVAEATKDYYNIRIWGSPVVLINFVILGSFIALQQTKYIFFHQLLLNLTNIILDFVFVLAFDWQVKGVAIATVIANFAACTFGFYWLVKVSKANGIKLSIIDAAKQRLSSYLPLMKLNANIMIRTACLVFSFAFMTYMSTQLGTLFLAANAILLHFQSIMSYGLDGFADATESLTGRAYGKRSPSHLLLAVKYSTVWAAVTALICCFIYLLFGEQIIRVFSVDQVVIATASQYLPWLIISPLISVWSFQLDGIYVGTTFSVEMRNGMLVSTCFFVLCCMLLVPQWHNHGLWLAFLCFMAVRAIILALWFPRIPRSIDSPG